jgi:hypothetical protein
MEKRFRAPVYFRWIGVVILLLSLLCMTWPAATPAQAQEKTGFVITSLSPAESQICIGQKVSVFGEYAYKHSPDDPLVPLGGPDKIVTKGGQGGTDPQNLYPGLPSGSFEFEYVGVKAGQDLIFADIIYDGKSVDEGKAPITVTQKCIYSYRLVEHLIVDASKGDSIIDKFEETLKTVGKVVLDNSVSSIQLTGTSKIEETTDYLDVKAPNCKLITWSPGYAVGYVKATADISSGSLVKFQIAKPEKFDWLFNFEMVCDGRPSSKSLVFDLSQAMQDPLVEEEFLPDGGTKVIKSDPYKQACQKGGMTCTYNVTLTVTRERGQ